MTVSQFTHRWLARQNMLNTESVYDAYIGREVLHIVEFLQRSAYSVRDLSLVLPMVLEIYRGFSDQDNEVWRQYRDEQRRKSA